MELEPINKTKYLEFELVSALVFFILITFNFWFVEFDLEFEIKHSRF